MWQAHVSTPLTKLMRRTSPGSIAPAMIVQASSFPGWVAPLALWLHLRLLAVPEGLSADAWHYFAVFAAAISASMVTGLPGGGIGLVAVAFIVAMRYVHDDPTRSLARDMAQSARR
jgi:hypothetical protein